MTIPEQQDVPGIGDNNPPPDDENPLFKLDPEKLVVADDVLALLELHYKPLLDRKEALLKQVDDWVEDHTPAHDEDGPIPKPQVGDEQDLMDATDLVAQIRDFMSKEVEVTRKKVKNPIDAAGAAIQKYFAKEMADVLKAALVPIVDAQSLALIEKEKRARKKLREEAWAKAQEANRLAVQSARATGVRQKESLLNKAMEIEAEVEQLEKAAEGSARELTRTRTDMQEVTGLRSSWKYEVVQIMDLLMAIVGGRQDLLPCVQVDEVYVNGLIRGKDGVRNIPGLHIFEEKKAG